MKTLAHSRTYDFYDFSFQFDLYRFPWAFFLRCQVFQLIVQVDTMREKPWGGVG